MGRQGRQMGAAYSWMVAVPAAAASALPAQLRMAALAGQRSPSPFPQRSPLHT